jgi:hypothetical protein
MLRRLCLAAALILLSSGLAAAEDLGKLRQACGAEVKKLCAGIQPGGGRIAQCMREHGSELSEACQTAIAEAMAARSARQGAAGSSQGTTGQDPIKSTTTGQ